MSSKDHTEEEFNVQAEAENPFPTGTGNEDTVFDSTDFGGMEPEQDSTDFGMMEPKQDSTNFGEVEPDDTYFGETPQQDASAVEEEKKKTKRARTLKIALVSAGAVILLVAAAAAAFFVKEKSVLAKAEEYRDAGEYAKAAEEYGKLWFTANSASNARAMSALEMIRTGETEGGIKELLEAQSVVHILYDLNGGSFLNSENLTDISYNDPAKFTSLFKAKKDHYSFEGWEVKEAEFVAGENWNTAELELIAQYVPIEYTISYTNLLDGETNSPKSYTVESSTIMIREPVREGYTFTHWAGHELQGDEKVIVIRQGETGDRIYIANWTPNTYKVTFEPDGTYDIPKFQNVRFDDNYKLPEIEKAGYSYQGWTDGKDVYKDGVWTHIGDILVKPSWKVVDYTITYELGGGTITGSAPLKYNIESKKITLGKPTRSGYMFSGWTDGSEKEATKEYTIAPGSVGDLKVRAQWQGNPHTVTLNANGGSVSQGKADVVFGSKYALPVPYRKGFSFTGWTNGKRNLTQGTWDIDQDITVTAGWEPSRYTVTLDPAGGSCSAAQVGVVYGSRYSLPVPSRTGYTFQGWYSGETKVADGVWETESNLALKAAWKGNNYRITLNASGGKCDASYIDVVFGSSYQLPTPYKKGYKCTGWYNSGTKYSSGTWQTASNITLTAKYDVWTSTVKYDANGGTVSPAKQKITYGDAYKLATPTRKGYTFLCWVDEDGGKEIPASGFDWEYETNFDLIAKWEGNKCAVRLDAGSGASVDPSSVQAVFGSDYSLPVPKMQGYTFTGWYDGSEKVESSGKWSIDAATVTLSAKWEQSKYVIRLDPAGGTCSTQSITVTYGGRLSLPTCERKGYDFAGWRSDLGDISSGKWEYESGATLTALWSGKQYTVMLDPAGGNVGQGQVTVTYGADYSLPVPERKGYEFLGWKSGGSTLSGGTWNIAENVSAKADWAEAKYRLSLDAAGGSVSPKEILFTYGQNVSLPQPTYEGNDFLGWYCEGASFNGTCNFDHDVTAVAEWRGKQYKIIMDSDGGGCDGTVGVEFGGYYSLPEPEKEGFIFEGWFAGGSAFPSDGTYRAAKDTSVKARYMKAAEE